MLSLSWNLLANDYLESRIRSYRFECWKNGTGLRLQTAEGLHLRQFIASLAFHRRGCGCSPTSDRGLSSQTSSPIWAVVQEYNARLYESMGN